METFQPIFRTSLSMPDASSTTGDLRVSDLTGIRVTLIQGGAANVLQTLLESIPAGPGDLVEVGDGFLGRLTPMQFYLFGKSTGAQLPTAAELEDSFVKAKLFAHTIDQTHGTAALKLAGAEASEALSKICGLDFHDTVFPTMQVKQTSAAKIKTLIARCDEAGVPTYHLHVSRPLGQYFLETLWDAGQEFGIGAG